MATTTYTTFAPTATVPDATISTTVTSLGTIILRDFLLIAGIMAVIYVVLSGFQFIIADTPDKTKTARTALVNSLIGIVVVIATYTIIRMSVSLGTVINRNV